MQFRVSADSVPDGNLTNLALKGILLARQGPHIENVRLRIAVKRAVAGCGGQSEWTKRGKLALTVEIRQYEGEVEVAETLGLGRDVYDSRIDAFTPNSIQDTLHYFYCHTE